MAHGRSCNSVQWLHADLARNTLLVVHLTHRMAPWGSRLCVSQQQTPCPGRFSLSLSLSLSLSVRFSSYAARKATNQRRVRSTRLVESVPYSAKGGAAVGKPAEAISAAHLRRALFARKPRGKRGVFVSVLCCLLCVSEYGASVWLSVVLAAQCSSNSLLHTYSPLCAVYHERWAHLFHLVECPYRALILSPSPWLFDIPLFIPGPKNLFPLPVCNKQTRVPFLLKSILAQDFLIISRVYKDTKPPGYFNPHFFKLACSACALAFVLAACHHDA
ncbi:hypothetical protein V8C44DRAFT_304145 [Trichoderma aethiopicum]